MKDGRDLKVDVVPGRYVDTSQTDVFIHQNEGDKERLKTNIVEHVTHVRDSGIIMANIPLALIGNVIALTLAGQPLSVASMIGFITLAGISARNGILKISHYINLALHEGETFSRDLVVRGSLERLTPVLMTALSAGLALTPLLVGAGEPGREILHPVAVTIFGGLISSTLLDTFLTPTLFLKFGARPLERLLAERPSSGLVEAF